MDSYPRPFVRVRDPNVENLGRLRGEDVEPIGCFCFRMKLLHQSHQGCSEVDWPIGVANDRHESLVQPGAELVDAWLMVSQRNGCDDAVGCVLSCPGTSQLGIRRNDSHLDRFFPIDIQGLARIGVLTMNAFGFDTDGVVSISRSTTKSFCVQPGKIGITVRDINVFPGWIDHKILLRSEQKPASAEIFRSQCFVDRGNDLPSLNRLVDTLRRCFQVALHQVI